MDPPPCIETGCGKDNNNNDEGGRGGGGQSPTLWKPKVFVTGGNTGADSIPLECYHLIGGDITVDGYMPKGYKRTDGNGAKVAAMHGLKECSGGYATKDRLNAASSDALIAFLSSKPETGRGTKKTIMAFIKGEYPAKGDDSWETIQQPPHRKLEYNGVMDLLPLTGSNHRLLFPECSQCKKPILIIWDLVREEDIPYFATLTRHFINITTPDRLMFAGCTAETAPDLASLGAKMMEAVYCNPIDDNFQSLKEFNQMHNSSTMTNWTIPMLYDYDEDDMHDSHVNTTLEEIQDHFLRWSNHANYGLYDGTLADDDIKKHPCDKSCKGDSTACCFLPGNMELGKGVRELMESKVSWTDWIDIWKNKSTRCMYKDSGSKSSSFPLMISDAWYWVEFIVPSEMRDNIKEKYRYNLDAYTKEWLEWLYKPYEERNATIIKERVLSFLEEDPKKPVVVRTFAKFLLCRYEINCHLTPEETHTQKVTMCTIGAAPINIHLKHLKRAYLCTHLNPDYTDKVDPRASH